MKSIHACVYAWEEYKTYNGHVLDKKLRMFCRNQEV